MKKITSLSAIVLLAASSWLAAGEPEKPKQASPEFERLKTLVGTWQGKTDMGQGPIDMTVQYRLLAAGSVLEERVFAGTPNEMVTMYYDKGGKLALTHYCVFGNRPGMLLKSSDTKTLKFDFQGVPHARFDDHFRRWGHHHDQLQSDHRRLGDGGASHHAQAGEVVVISASRGKSEWVRLSFP